VTQIDSLKTEKKFKKTEIGEIPVDWNCNSLDEISKEIYKYPTYYSIEYVDKGIPEVRGELIKSNGTVENDLSKYRFISVNTASQFPRTLLKEGDFVMSVRGTMGKVAIIPEFLDGANITANLIKISPDRNKIFPLFLHQIFISENFQDILNITSSITTIKTIKATELKEIKFAVPPLNEQKKIAEILSSVDEKTKEGELNKEKLENIKKGVMQVLLTGKIRVKI
jgi:type I restriction enzyme S subunit